MTPLISKNILKTVDERGIIYYDRAIIESVSHVWVPAFLFTKLFLTLNLLIIAYNIYSIFIALKIAYFSQNLNLLIIAYNKSKKLFHNKCL